MHFLTKKHFLLSLFMIALMGCEKEQTNHSLTTSGDEIIKITPESANNTGPHHKGLDTVAGFNGQFDTKSAGSPFPAVNIHSPNGSLSTLADIQKQNHARPLLVNLWATWCAPCIAEMPTLEALAQSHNIDLTVLVISQDHEPERVPAFFAEHNFQALQPFTDPQMAMSDALKIQTLPATIYYDTQGKEIWRYYGTAEWNDTEVKAFLEKQTAPEG